jgi:flagellin
VTAPSTTATPTANALTALNSITSAVSNLGSVQGIVGAGINKLNYAVSLAQSQITNFSVAQSNIRDANIAAEAANLTKAQVLQQASLAALAQANSAPQSLLALLK